VYELLVGGSPSQAICEELGLAERTLKHQHSRVLEKLDVKSMVQLVRGSGLRGDPTLAEFPVTARTELADNTPAPASLSRG